MTKGDSYLKRLLVQGIRSFTLYTWSTLLHHLTYPSSPDLMLIIETLIHNDPPRALAAPPDAAAYFFKSPIFNTSNALSCVAFKSTFGPASGPISLTAHKKSWAERHIFWPAEWPLSMFGKMLIQIQSDEIEQIQRTRRIISILRLQETMGQSRRY